MNDSDTITRRAQSYLRVMETLRDLGEGALLPDEREALREACDALIFGEEGAVAALREAAAVCERLAESGRWRGSRARALLADVEGCADPELLASV
jgi:hypothetical protein